MAEKKPIFDIKEDIQFIKERITNIENNIKELKEINDMTKTIIANYIFTPPKEKEPIKIEKGWFF